MLLLFGSDHGQTLALLEIDLKNAFNEALRQAALMALPALHHAHMIMAGCKLATTCTLSVPFGFSSTTSVQFTTRSARFDMWTTKVRCTTSRARAAGNKATLWR